MDTNEPNLRAEYDQITERMQDSSLFGTPEMSKIGRRQAELQELITLYDRLHKLEHNLASNRGALSDPELKELAEAEIPELEHELATVQDKLKLALVPKDPQDGKNAIVEIRAGAGGDEASLFAGELYR